ncbi:MAG: hypothetical protein QOI34_1246 [Verrucomicrobiota bacterium]
MCAVKHCMTTKGRISGRLENIGYLACLAFILRDTVVAADTSHSSQDEARVTRIIHDVKVLPADAKARPAELDQKVNAGTAVRTGDRSRSELTFVDLTIERLGANTLFSFDRAGRSVQLESGSMLLRVPKSTGGASMTTRAVTVGITGTTVILETTRSGGSKLTVLEGDARVGLRKNARESVHVQAGQMEDVPAGATKLPPPVNVDLNEIMKDNPLITDFGPLPSRDLIYAAMQNRPPAHDQPSVIPSILGNILGGGGVVVGPHSGGLHTTGGRQPVGGRSKLRGQDGPGVNDAKKSGTKNAQQGKRPTPTPTPGPRK